MIDKYKRNIDYVRISITDRCDFRCTYCMPDEGVTSLSMKDILSYEQIQEIVTNFVALGIKKIKITGGEPFVRKDAVNIIKMMKETEGIESVTVTSNGNAIFPYIQELEQIGIDGVNISLDTLDKDRFFQITHRNALPTVLKSIEALSKTKLPLKINCVPLKETPIDDLINLAMFAKDKNIQVRFIEMMPIGLGKKHISYSKGELLEIFTSHFSDYEEVHETLGNGPATYVHYANFKANIGFIAAMSHKFCEGCNRIRLSADGQLKQCLFHEDGLNLKEIIEHENTASNLLEELEDVILHKREEYDLKKQSEAKLMAKIGG